MAKTYETDRSRNEAFQKCPRLRFLAYEYPHPEGEANGLSLVPHAVPLLTGSMVHKGIELFLTGFGEGGALDGALSAYDENVTKHGIVADDLAPEPQWVIYVQRALIEALVSGWIGFVYPRIENEFEVIEVEREERASFYDNGGNGSELVLMARTDLVVQRKSDGAIFVRNLKTMADPQLRRLEAFRYDTQTISEVIAVEQRMGTAISGVIYDVLIKGPRKVEYPKGSGVWHNASPLIWCWQKEGQTGITDDEFAAKYEYVCKEPHGSGRWACPGGENHRLGKGWHRKLVTEVVPGGVNGWFNWLQTHEPGLIDEQFQTLTPIMRTPFDVATWERTIVGEELEIAARAEACADSVREKGYLASLPILDDNFPKHTHNANCLFPSKCPMFDICWGAAGTGEPEDAELYSFREPNHPEGVVSE